MNVNPERTPQDVVNVVGNAWVTGRSKRYPDRVYYFNTLTGKSAWNLSDSEMKKARSSFQHQDCPEPQEPPVDVLAQPSTDLNTIRPTGPSQIYNKQIINNQISRLPFGPPANASCSTCVNSSSQIPGYNPNVWSIPPVHQIFISPAIATMDNQSQPNGSLASQHKSPTGPTNNYYNRSITGKRFPYRGKFRGKFLGPRKGYQHYNRRRQYQESPDLREMLMAKRQLQDYCNQQHQNKDTEPDTRYQSEGELDLHASTSTQSENEPKEFLYSSDVDEDWLEANTHYEGTKPILDISALSRLASKHGDSKCWYIVVDASILLNHLDFLNVLLNSDDKCSLIVQQVTMSELREGTACSDTRLKKRCRRALCFLSQQINSKNAVVDDQHNNEDAVFGRYHQALSCCILLSENNQHIILLTDDEDLIEYKSEVTFPIFTVNDMKKFLEAKYSDVQVQFPEADEELSITIPNDTSEDVDIKMSPTDIGCEFIRNDDELLPSTSGTDGNTVVSKSTVDAEVQTDCADEIVVDTTTVEVNNDEFTYANSPQTQRPVEAVCNMPKESVSNDSSDIVVKKKEIRLKRNKPAQTQNTDKQTKCNILDNQVITRDNRNKKWNRNKNKLQSNSSSVSESSSRVQNAKSVEDSTMPGDMTDADQNMSVSDIVDNSETSSYIISRRNIKEQVVIEETSTSGAISNSVDSGSVSSLPQVYTTYSCNSEKQNKNVMFEITSPFMEEHLRRNSDEWISRFLQIMEEVLTQVLRQTPAFVHVDLPPPWTAPEAVQCTKKKYKNQPDVVDACTKLSDIFFKLSDAKGNILRNIHPAQFMEMYSYGVYLIDSLVSVQDSEDLQSSTESLTKLLSDIQDPNLEAMNNSFAENMNDLSLNVQQTPIMPVTPTITEENVILPPYTSTVLSKNSTPTSGSTTKQYSLRSAVKKISAEKDKLPEVKCARNPDPQSTFFSSLNLRKNKEQTIPKKCVEPKIVDDKIPVDNHINVNPVDAGPKIIRNFTQCLEFENRIKNKSRPQLDSDELDNENYDKGGDDYDFDECFDKENTNTETSDHQLVSETEDPFLPGNSNDQYGSSTSSDHDNFKWFIASVWCEIRDIITKVHTFCVNTIQSLQNGRQQSSTKNIEIRDDAEKSRKELHNLCTVLQSVILNRPGSVQEILRYFSLDSHEDIIMNEEQLDKYREMVSKCTDQAEILLKPLSLIIDATNK